jgi:hypothetical protein
MSLLSFAHVFCQKNKLTIGEFCQLFTKRGATEQGKSSELVNGEKSALDVSTPINECNRSWARLSGFYANDYAVTHSNREVHRSLRYCKSCLAKGYHFSWQQISWVQECPIHDEQLETHCDCGKKVRYTLKQFPARLGQLCACDGLRFGPIQPLSDQERKRLLWLLHGLGRLRINSPRAYECVRFGRGRPNGNELVRADRMIRLRLLRLVEHRFDDVTENTHNFAYENDLCSDPRVAIDSAFEDLFSLLDRRNSDDWQTCFCQRVGADWASGIFDEKVFDRIHEVVKVNGDAISFDDCRIGYAAKVFAYRAIINLLNGRFVNNRNNVMHFDYLAKRLAQPLCLFEPVQLSGERVARRVYWVPSVRVDRTPEYPWVQDLGEFLVSYVFYGEKGGDARLRNLRELKYRPHPNIDYIGHLLGREPTDQMTLFQ